MPNMKEPDYPSTLNRMYKDSKILIIYSALFQIWFYEV